MDGQRHGEGRIVYAVSRTTEETFEGTFEQGRVLRGQGVFYTRNARQEGSFEHGHFVHGTVRYANGNEYTGSLVDGSHSGWGRLCRADGTLIYEGMWSGGEPVNVSG